MSYTNGTQTQSQSMNGLLEISTDSISASTITTDTLTATNATIDNLTATNPISGTITNSINILPVQDNTNFGYLSWIKYTDGSFQPSNYSSSLFYNASENKITADLHGIADNATNATFATSATTATNAVKIGVNTTTTNATHYPTFVNALTGNLFPFVSSDFTFNPVSKMLTSVYATVSELTTNSYIFNYGSENATSLATGALRIINGGMSVAQDFFLGGSINIAGDNTVTGTLSVAGNSNSITKDLTVGSFLNANSITSTNGINGGICIVTGKQIGRAHV